MRPLTDADFAQMAAMGFSVVRLAVSWSLLEPTPGTLDGGYVARIRRAVDQAAAHDMVTVIDLHQDAWGRGVVAPMGTTCPIGTTPLTGGDGAPGWATPFDGSKRCAFLRKELAPVVSRAFTDFYADRDGIQSRLVRDVGTAGPRVRHLDRGRRVRAAERPRPRRDPAADLARPPSAASTPAPSRPSGPPNARRAATGTWSSSSRPGCGRPGPASPTIRPWC